ncbi:hypothetical protein [Psychroserpens sp.]|uniref:hypothetical protein n=1 Tax=Psychroserpens sp. TaxID=2020870 RepID=UPI001B2CE394|nr:hypothetical protein [Psychroserpens sp.]MBO6605490.1 hypothetical protein [Psychroserpens sp.]MBO6630669.1 hypothetical protein [Psychroserpens sp.]MBO6653701.1 hypothetical protein [Psychroserpens sp.]MBO6682022.1 hypothetical protein [Psychroserpens sp.]MBO6748864.1 hypothetical protein [Psychroserpens sp.]
MKKIQNAFTLLLITILIYGCSTVKVLDSWKSDDIGDIKSNSFLVVARTNNTQARVAFENEIVKQMTAKGYKATSSLAKFGDWKPNDVKEDDDPEKLKQILKNEGFNGVVLTVMKDFKEETRIQQDGGYYAGGTYYGYYPRYYGGFYGYFYNPMSYRTLGNYVPVTTTTTTSKLYILETTVYNLKETGENQLVAVVTSQLDNPQNATETAEEYVKKIAQSLK